MRARPGRTKGPDLAIDLGTSNTRIANRSGQVLLDAPSVVAFQPGHNTQPVAVGEQAHRMVGRAPAGTSVVKPIQNGMVADFHATEMLLRAFLGQVAGKRLTKPRLLVCIPSDVTEAERRAVQESARAAGGRDVCLVPSAMASAIGVGLPIQDPVGSMVIDIGGGRTEVAVISLGGMVVRKCVPFGGDAMEAAIIQWLAQTHQMGIGDRTAEKLKLRIGSAVVIPRPKQLRIRGRDLAGGTPKELALNTNQLVEAMLPAIEAIKRVVADVLAQTPPELSADIIDRGVLLCGGGSQLSGLDQVLRNATGLPVLGVAAPTQAAVAGAATLLGDPSLLSRLTSL
jgi:rod shape-determining protein MreB